MPLQSTGEIKLSQIATEFTDAAPHQMSEFYSAATGIPASGEISMADFYGAASGPATPDKEKFKLAQFAGSDIYVYVPYAAATQKQVATPERMVTALTTVNDADDSNGRSISGGDALITLPKSSTGNGGDFKLSSYYYRSSGSLSQTSDVGLKQSLPNITAINPSDTAYGGPAGFQGFLDVVISDNGNASNYSQSLFDDMFDLADYWPTRGSSLQDSWDGPWNLTYQANSNTQPHYGFGGSNFLISNYCSATVDRTKFMDGITVDGTDWWWWFRPMTSSSTLGAPFPGYTLDSRTTNEVGTWILFLIYIDSETTDQATAQSLADDLNGSSASYSSKLYMGNAGTSNKYSVSNFFNDARISGLTNGSVLIHTEIMCYLTNAQGADVYLPYGTTAQSQIIKDWDDQFWNGTSSPANFSSIEIYQ